MASKQQSRKRSAASKRTKAKRSKKVHVQEISLKEEIFLLCWLVFCILLFLGGFGLGGSLTERLNQYFFGWFGTCGYLFPVLLFATAFFVLAGTSHSLTLQKIGACWVSFVSLCVLCQLVDKSINYTEEMNQLTRYFEHARISKQGGGVVGGLLYSEMRQTIGVPGTAIVCVVFIVIGLIVITRKSLFKSLKSRGQRMFDSVKEDAKLHRQLVEAKREENIARKRQENALRIQEEQLRRKKEEQERKRQLRQIQSQTKKTVREIEHTNMPGTYSDTRNIQSQRRTPVIRRGEISLDETDLRRGREDEGRTAQKTARRKAGSAKPNRNEHPVEQMRLDMQPMGRVGVTSAGLMPALRDPAKEFTITRDGHSIGSPAPETAVKDDAQLPASEQRMESQSAEKPDETTLASDQKTKSVSKEKKVSEKTKQETQSQIASVNEEIAAASQNNVKNFRFPPLSLLQKNTQKTFGDSDEHLRETASKLERVLESFGVKVTVLDVSCGPAVTRYELQPEIGVKVSRIVGLADDIKLNLAVPDIRIEAPIPGKPAVGIEVPNTSKSAVYLRELLQSKELKGNKSVLAFPAGKDIAGNVIVADLAKMPHMLVAGTTGSGKSVFTNSIIMSMLFRASPKELRFIIIDPKVVEFGVYNGIPHLMIPVVTDPKKAAGALNWAVAEMSERYKKFAEYHVRDLQGYNEKVLQMNGSSQSEQTPAPEPLPKIVIIIDELADLMMVAAKEVEDAICRLAQLARAAGIHMVIATQRPSVDVVTGLIKANIPSRVALSVASGTDSRTILDMNGAEKLLGNGDMLFYPSGYPKPVRVQGAFVSDREVGDVVDFLKEQNGQAVYDAEVEEKVKAAASVSVAAGASDAQDDRDIYFADAGRFIIEKEKASIGMLQRMFKIGFNRAARVMDQLSEAGVVGPEEGTKPRKILMTLDQFEAYMKEERTHEE